ncbi:MAG: hypothetical protein JRI54_12630 [Deltaproteobacteria bacterium]|nr:hypothetical protein [Deltaproteobacteria bacterium]
MPNLRFKGEVSGVLALFMAFGLMLLLGSDISFADEPEYVGVLKCKGCHKKQYAAWLEEKHSQAMSSLSEAEQKDARCLECHTTGYGKPAKTGARLENVQCESCHGPGSLFKRPRIMNRRRFREDREKARQAALAAGLIEPTEKVCLKCHGNQPPAFKEFNFREAVEKVNHK